jgi:hypothetical protein
LFDDAKFAYDTYAHCRAGGGSDGMCSLMVPVCIALKKFLENAKAGGVVPLNTVLPPLDKTFCLGEPSLKCCKTATGCHSAFNTEAPINCEGNPHYG